MSPMPCRRMGTFAQTCIESNWQFSKQETLTWPQPYNWNRIENALSLWFVYILELQMDNYTKYIRFGKCKYPKLTIIMYIYYNSTSK